MNSNKLTYLDNASTTFPKPDVVHETVKEFYSTNGVNPGRTGCDLAKKAEAMVNETRSMYSDFFNKSLIDAGKTKDSNRLVFTMNATMSLNLIIHGTVEPGDHVVTTLLEHNSVIRPVNHLVKRGAEATFVAPDDRGYINPEDIKKAIKPNTRLVVINHGSNVSGVVQDLTAIGKVCREANVPLAVDTAQTAGVIPIDMHKSHISYLTFTGHKGLFGPSGTGGICVADDATVRPTLYGGTGIKSADPYHVEEFPYVLEAGTLNLGGIAGLNSGLKWIQTTGIDTLFNHEMTLLKQLIDGLKTIPAVKIWGTDSLENRVATLSFTIKDQNTLDVGKKLDQNYGIQTRPGLHCAPLIHEHYGSAPQGTVRISIGAFNTEQDINTALTAIAEIAG